MRRVLRACSRGGNDEGKLDVFYVVGAANAGAFAQLAAEVNAKYVSVDDELGKVGLAAEPDTPDIAVAEVLEAVLEGEEEAGVVVTSKHYYDVAKGNAKVLVRRVVRVGTAGEGEAEAYRERGLLSEVSKDEEALEMVKSAFGA